MASDSGSTSFLGRFFDSFLQERNIKWMLALGMLIMLGSSMFLVAMHWNDCTPFWKYLIFLGYTAAIFGAGQWTQHRLGLRRTGAVLLGLTVLLIPVLFLVLHWVPHDESALAAIHWGLLALTVVFTFPAARAIFEHFLRGPQPTFLFTYAALSLAGAVVPIVPTAWSPGVSLVLWALFAAGAVKVNRHVFWLTEEQRAPRIAAFLPIALLGTQFLGLFALYGARHLALPWLGFGCVLAAIPMLLTSDAVARVHQQRVGDFVRPLWWSIVAPLVLGLILCAAGVTLACLGLAPPNRPYALVPTAALTAALLGLVAYRTQKRAFVWAMLAAVWMTYQFAPVFFVETVKALAAQSAHLLREERLPFAFYGLTYLPLIAGLMIAALRADVLFAKPLRQFCVGLSFLLLLLSLGHVKALFPVAVLMVFVFALQTILFRDWRPALAAMIAWFLAACGLPLFAGQMLGVTLLDSSTCVILATALLLSASPMLDAWLAALPPQWLRLNLCRSVCLLMTCGLAQYWLLQNLSFPTIEAGWSGVLLAVLLLVQSRHWMRPALAGFSILFVHAVVIQQALAWRLPLHAQLALVTALLLGQWLLSYGLERSGETGLSRAFASVNSRIAMIGLSALWTGLFFPLSIFDLSRPALLLGPSATLLPLTQIDWSLRILMLIWSFDLARRLSNPLVASLACAALFLLGGAGWLSIAGNDAWHWLPSVWAGTALICLPVADWLHRRAATQAIERPLSFSTLSVLCAVEFASLLTFGIPMRVAGGVALIGLIAFSLLRRQTYIRLPALIVINMQVLCLTVQLSMPELATIFDLRNATLLPLCLPIAAVTAASLLCWQLGNRSSRDYLAVGQRWLLRALLVYTLAGSLKLAGLSEGEAILAACAFLLAAGSEVLAACRHRHEGRVWLAEAAVVAGLVYLMHFGAIDFGNGLGMFVALGSAFILWIVKEAVQRRPALQSLVRPAHWTALVLPLVAVILGVYRHVSAQPVWLGANSLVLLLAAGFYFWRGVEQHAKNLLILPGVILNIALLLLWNELAWNDPQLFMVPIGISILALVQLLREQIPHKLLDPLRYLGALVILVSPTFHIVDQSWLHLFCLMVASVAVVLLAMGLRVRALMYTGTAFLLADLAAMVVVGSIENSNVLWAAGLILGGAVLTFGAYCERHRELLVQRIRLLTDALKEWE